MDCDLETFVNEILGKWGFTLSDWVYLQQAYEREKIIQDQMNKRDKYPPGTEWVKYRGMNLHPAFLDNDFSKNYVDRMVDRVEKNRKKETTSISNE